jgi:signal transduction histidine kinase
VEASQHKSQFLANMSHELRTPLNAIIGVTEMLREDARDLKRGDEFEPLDRVLGRQALLNLMSNANKFTERGTITIDARQGQEGGVYNDDNSDFSGSCGGVIRWSSYAGYFARVDVRRSLYKYENNGEFTVDELIKLIPASLMAGIPNVAPAEEPR